jgi:putative heme-binding domain-containing protein
MARLLINSWQCLTAIAFVGLVFTANLGAAEGTASNELTAPPHWIRMRPPIDQQVKLSRKLKIERSIQTAELKFAADFCEASVAINGRRVLSVLPYCQLQTLDLTAWVKRGENEIVIEARQNQAAAAVALSLVITHAEGKPTVLISDGEWAAADLGEVPPQFWGVGRRGIELSPFENYEQWQQAKTDSKKPAVPKFWSVPGFEVTELRVAKADEGSWISLAFDSAGRMIISREDQGFLRMTLDEGHKSISKLEPIASDLKECRGLAYDGPWLYAKANNSLGLYRLKIDDAGKTSEQQELRQFPGKLGHGRNDIVFDRKERGHWLYQIHGDSVEFPQADFRDHTSPLNETKTKGRGREGSLWRCDAEGQNWELLCAGLRNPYGIDLHEAGDPFTFDADNEYDMGTPWYRPTRILQLLTGGDTGYRESTGVFPPRFHDQPDHAPPLLHIGRSSPTSVMFGYDLKFPPPYCNALFALDWTYGRVLAIHLAPRGATYRAAAELFLQGRPLNVTDVAAGPDGSMYLITGGRKTQSALYRVSYVGDSPKSNPEGMHERAACEFSQTIRRESTGDRPFLRMIFARQHVESADPVVRHAARIELERGKIAEIQELVQAADRRSLVACLALARARRVGDIDLILNTLQRDPVINLDLSRQFIWLRIVGLCYEISPEKVDAHRETLIAELVSLAKALNRGEHGGELRIAPEGTSDELRRRVAYLLADLRASELPEFAAKQLLNSSKQEDQLAALLALRNTKTGWTLETRQAQFRALNEIPKMIGGAGLPPFEKWLRPQILQTLTPEEEVALADLLNPKATTDSEPLPPPRAQVQKWTLADLAAVHTDDGPRGDAKRGAVLFRDALCSRCHRVNLKGAAVGPDLTHVSRRFSRRDILESILAPSLSVAENYRLEQVLTESGQVYTGRVVNEGDYRSEKLILALDPLQPDKIVELDKKEITEHRTTPTSPMPNGLLDTFTPEEIRDLLAYLEGG